MVCELDPNHAVMANRQCRRLKTLQDTREGAPAVSEKVGEEGGGCRRNEILLHCQVQLRCGMRRLCSGAESAV